MSVLPPPPVTQTLTIPVKLLADWLRQARPFIAASAAFPALECIRLILNETGTLTMTAGDGQSVLTLSDSLGESAPFALCLPHKTLDRFVSTLTDETITLDSKTPTACQITYQGGTFTLPAEPAVDYPDMHIDSQAVSWEIEGESSATLGHYLSLAAQYTMKPEMLGADQHRCVWLTPTETGADVYASSGREFYLLAHPPIERPPLCIPWPRDKSDKYLPVLALGQVTTISMNADRSWLTVQAGSISASVRLYNLPDTLGESFYQKGCIPNMKNARYGTVVRGQSAEWTGCLRRIKALPEIDKLGNLMSVRWKASGNEDGLGKLKMAADDTVGDYKLGEVLDVSVEGEDSATPKGFRVPLLLDAINDLGKGLIELHTNPANESPLSLRNPANPTLQIVLLNIQVK